MNYIIMGRLNISLQNVHLFTYIISAHDHILIFYKYQAHILYMMPNIEYNFQYLISYIYLALYAKYFDKYLGIFD
jgi:hypothetical protein